VKTVKVARRLQLGFGLPIAILIALSVVSYRSVVASTAGAARVRHTHRVIERLARLLSDTKDLDANYRGFALVGDERFFAAYEDARTKVPADQAAIATLTVDNPEQQRRLAELTALVDRKIQFGDEIVRLRREGGVQAASERVASGDGVRLTEEIRKLIGAFGDDEELVLATRLAIADRDFKRITIVLALGIFGSILVLGLAGWTVARDTTARRESEQALQGSEDRLRHERDRAQRYLDTAQVILLALDTEGRVTAVNRFACAVLGWTEDELLGRDWFDTCQVARARDQSKARFGELLRGDLSITEDTTCTRSGDERLIEWRSTVLRDDAGQVTGTFSSGTDITDRHQVEAELRTARDAAEAANKAKSEFLANMSHEIRTPMNGVIGMTELVLDTELTPDQREHLRIVKSSAEALLTVINDILDFSRMEAGKFELDPIDFNPRDAIGDTANAVALKAHQKGLEVIVDVSPAVAQMLRGDVGRLRQILVNLLGNAIKFTTNGEVVLRVTTEVSMLPGVVLHFSVRDTGVGIPLDRQKSVFDAFTQADGSITRTFGGTGLGLTISSQLVKLMGGRIWVESEAGKGSTFHFTANFAVAEDPTAAAVADAVDLRNLPVLVVDDNATNRRLLEEMLIGWHMGPTLSASAPEALAALRVAQEAGRPFHLVLTDVQMPDMDGFTLAEAIKKDPATAGAAVVMLTSAGQPGDAARCRELGVAAYLPKPIKSSELRETILLALAGQPAERNRPVLVTRNSLREARHVGRLLLVEDNKVNQLVARRLLEKRGYTVLVANNGREALAILDDRAIAGFGCVLMDVQMPEMGGFECTAAIRAREQVTRVHLPIVAMTAHAMKGDEARCLAAGMDGYLSKPIDPNELFDVVAHHLRLSSGADARSAPRPQG
jgi:two-component system, sensor histidine kinase and response regulator